METNKAPLQHTNRLVLYSQDPTSTSRQYMAFVALRLHSHWVWFWFSNVLFAYIPPHYHHFLLFLSNTYIQVTT